MNNAYQKLIDTTLTRLTEKQSKNGGIARMVQKVQEDDPSLRLAKYFMSCKTNSTNAKAANNEYSGHSTVAVARFVQQVMNSACWATRASILAEHQRIENERDTGMLDSADFTGELTESKGFDEHASLDLHVDPETCQPQLEHNSYIETLMEVCRSLAKVHSWMEVRLYNKSQLNSFHLLASSSPTDELNAQGYTVWAVDYAIDDWDSAQVQMQLSLEKLAEEQEAEDLVALDDVDFGGEAEEPKTEREQDLADRRSHEELSANGTAKQIYADGVPTEAVGNIETVVVEQEDHEIAEAHTLVQSLPNIKVDASA